MIALVDYGVGNLRSVEKALTEAGGRVTLTSEAETILAADKVVLPGVGAFGDSMAGLKTRGLIPVIETVVARNVPLLGICVGMQMLFEESEEHGRHRGLGFLPGAIRRFEANHLKVPHTGWNQLQPESDSPIVRDLEPGSFVYFNHSYYCDAGQHTDVAASTEYGISFTSVVGRGKIYGVQFHPEKSQQVGLTILRNFLQYC